MKLLLLLRGIKSLLCVLIIIFDVNFENVLFPVLELDFELPKGGLLFMLLLLLLCRVCGDGEIALGLLSSPLLLSAVCGLVSLPFLLF